MIGGHPTAEGTPGTATASPDACPPALPRARRRRPRAPLSASGLTCGREDDATRRALPQGRRPRARARRNVLDKARGELPHQRSDGRSAPRGRGPAAVIAGPRRGRGRDQGRFPAVRRRGPERSRRLLPGDLPAARDHPARRRRRLALHTARYPARSARPQPDQLGLETVDVYYVHNPETQLTRCRAGVSQAGARGFAALEEAGREGRCVSMARPLERVSGRPSEAGYLSWPSWSTWRPRSGVVITASA